MFWPPNVAGVLWFARDVLPLIWARLPEARFVIVGKNPPEEVQALAADPRIQVTGYVADPLPYLQAADAFVVPLFSGGGMRVKILDAWLWGLPIVSTPLGAEGIDLRDGENILLAADPASFAEATVRLLTDPTLNHRLRTQGRAWVELAYDWQKIYPRVDAVYENLIAKFPEVTPRRREGRKGLRGRKRRGDSGGLTAKAQRTQRAEWSEKAEAEPEGSPRRRKGREGRNGQRSQSGTGEFTAKAQRTAKGRMVRGARSLRLRLRLLRPFRPLRPSRLRGELSGIPHDVLQILAVQEIYHASDAMLQQRNIPIEQKAKA